MRIVTALLALIGLLMLGSPAPAQEGEASGEAAVERPARRRPARERPARGRGFRAEAYYQRLQRELDLTPAQQTQIKQMLDTHAQALANLQKKQGDPAERRAKWLKAREDGDEAALAKLREAMGKAAADRTALQNELNGKIKAVLSEEQTKKFELLAARGGRRPLTGARAIQAALRQMKLTEAEKTATDAIVAKTQKATEGKNRRERAELWNKAVEDIKKVLGPKRAEKFAQTMRDPNARARARAAFRGIELTEAQVDKIVKIQAEYREKLNSVLTEGQKAKLRTLRTTRGAGRVRGDRGAAREGARERPRARERGRDRERARPRPGAPVTD